MRITNSGQYSYCRWAESKEPYNIQNTSPAEYFQIHANHIRDTFASGGQPTGCHPCTQMEQHGKISGRQRQLLKVGVRVEQFEKTLASSPWLSEFTKTSCQLHPQDWQIDLGNFCNSACIFCDPRFSSRLATEWKQIGFIDQLPPANWSDDPALVKQLVDTLTQSPHVQYMHFIGGETLITPAFKTILTALIDAGLNKTATIGFTTNLSVWRNDVVDLLKEFQGLNLGLSIESFDSINDYVRWPAESPTIMKNLTRWQEVAAEHNWLLQFRTTPSCLTVHKLLPIYDYALAHNIVVESCNFLYRPEVLKPSVLPMHIREGIINSMQGWVDKHYTNSQTILNIRNPNTVQAQLVQDLSSYVNYLKSEPDESYRLPELVSWMKKIETNRGNSILTYLPEYEELFRSAGY